MTKLKLFGYAVAVSIVLAIYAMCGVWGVLSKQNAERARDEVSKGTAFAYFTTNSFTETFETNELGFYTSPTNITEYFRVIRKRKLTFDFEGPVVMDKQTEITNWTLRVRL